MQQSAPSMLPLATYSGSTVRLGIYPGGNWKADEVWIVYKNPSDSMALKASDIIVVSKRTGRVLYEVPAGDEG